MNRILLIVTLATGLLFGALMAAPGEPAPNNNDPVAQAANARSQGWWTSDAGRLVFFAVLEGLYEDGVSQEIVDIMLPPIKGGIAPPAGAPVNPQLRETRFHFIYSCPLCHPASEAFLLYAARQPFRGQKVTAIDTFGSTGGLPPDIEKKLRSDKHAERIAGLREAMDRWVGRRLSLMQLQPQERRLWEQKIKALRDQGNAALAEFQKGNNGDYFRDLYANWKFCPSCDGSADGCKIQ